MSWLSLVGLLVVYLVATFLFVLLLNHVRPDEDE